MKNRFILFAPWFLKGPVTAKPCGTGFQGFGSDHTSGLD